MAKRGVILSCLAILFLTLISSLALATITGWSGYQENQAGDGNERSYFSSWSNTTDGDTITLTPGEPYQVLADDLDDDGITEVMHQGAGFLSILQDDSPDTVGMSIVYSLYIGASPETHPAIFTNPQNGQKSYVFIANDTLHSFRWDGTQLIRTYLNLTLPDPFCNRWSGISCPTNADSCYAVCEDTVQNVTRLYQFNITNGSQVNIGINLSFVHLPAKGTLTASTQVQPFNVLAFACDQNRDTLFGVCAVRSDTLDFFTTFSSDGIIDDLATENGQQAETITNPVWIFVGGSENIIVAYLSKNGTTDGCGGAACAATNIVTPHVKALSLSGSTSWHTCGTSVSTRTYLGCGTITTEDFNVLSQPFQAFVNDDRKVCVAQSVQFSAGTTLPWLGCLDADTGSRDLSTSVGNPTNCVGCPAGVVNYWGSTFSGQSVSDMTSFGNAGNESNDFLLFGNTLYTTRDNVFVGLKNLSAYSLASRMASIIDTNDDGHAEIAVSSSTNTLFLYQEPDISADDLPELFQNLTSSGYYNYYSGATCRGTNTTFKAQECPGTGSGCNYNNDLASNTERLRTDCGTGTATTGTLTGTQPSVSCLYNTTGTFNVVIYLQENSHPTDLSQSNSQPITINVIDGTAGVTCNIASDLIGTSGDQSVPVSQLTSDTDIQNSFDTLWTFMFGFSSVGARARLFVAIGIIFLVIVAMMKIAPNNRSAPGIGLLLGTIGTFGIGLLNVWILIILLIGMILAFILMRVVFPTNVGQ